MNIPSLFSFDEEKSEDCTAFCTGQPITSDVLIRSQLMDVNDETKHENEKKQGFRTVSCIFHFLVSYQELLESEIQLVDRLIAHKKTTTQQDAFHAIQTRTI